MPFLSTRGGGSATGFGFGVGGVGGSFTDATVSGASTLEYTVGGIKYRSHAFLTVGNSATINFTGGDGGYGMLDIMCVAGGGGGGGTQNTNSNGYGGGGGAGGCILREKMRIADGNYSVTVGNGGAGNTSGNRGSNGGNSSIFSLTAVGGGGGGWTNDNNGTIQTGSAGGSGGGAAGGDNGGYVTGGGYTDGTGHFGGEGTGNTQGDYGGNGGGATEAGADGTDNVGMVARISGAQGQSSNGTESAGVGNSFRDGGVNGYAGGGTGFNNFVGSYGGGGGNTSNTSSATAGSANTGGGGGAGTQGGGGAAGGSGIVVVRYPIEIVNNSSDMAYLQNLSAGTHSIATTNGTGSISLTIVDQDGRKWAKIPWGTETSGSINGGHWKANRLYSVHTYGNHRKGIYSDSSDRWTNDIESQGPNEGSSQVIFNVGIRYQYCRIYCTEIQSHTASGSGVQNADWGTESGPVGRFSADLSGGFGDHPGWITGWDFDSTTGEPRYKMVSGNQSSSAWIAGSTGGWNAAEAGNVTRSFTSPAINIGSDPRGDGLYKHDKVGLLIAGGYQEYYRHNSGYFLIS
tara:strand:+ start:1751 stop:3466 length:1716 start_codon:yes stop_codon:yes gene_type:complete